MENVLNAEVHLYHGMPQEQFHGKKREDYMIYLHIISRIHCACITDFVILYVYLLLNVCLFIRRL
jgi:hypothetical protein